MCTPGAPRTMTSPLQAITSTEHTSDAVDTAIAVSGEGQAPVGRSPGQLMWRRFRRDKTGVISAIIVIFFILVALAAPLISLVYGKNPDAEYGLDNPGLLNPYGYPVLPNGGISSEFWFGIEPGLGRDVFTQLLYGIRTSLGLALAATVATTVIGVVVGIVIGYTGGR